MNEITLAATVENIAVVTAFVNEKLETLDCPLKAQMQIDIAVDEVLSNIARYAYPHGTGSVTVRVETAENPPSVLLTFIDGGIPFDPLKKPDPDTTLAADERAAGGLGIFMVKKSMDEMIYRCENGSNILAVRKILRS